MSSKRQPARLRLKASPESRSWIEDGNCLSSDPELFFPEDLPSRSRGDALIQQREVMIALLICSDCAVREQCLEYGMNDEFGIFGGTLPSQREAIRNKRLQNRGQKK